MKLIDWLLKIAGKDNLKLDERISGWYILQLCWRYGWMMVRGFLLSLGSGQIARDVFVGKRVRILQKSQLTMGRKCRLADGVYIDALSEYGVILDERVILGRNTRIECTGSLSHLGEGARIGARSTFGSDCYFGVAGGVQIGEDVVAGQYIRFHAENHEYNDLGRLIKDQGVTHKGIVVGNNCWIGAGAVFLDGAALGDGCVVAANAVVTKSFPENSVIGGVPAKVIKSRG